jgi:hypothetical protein
LPFVNLTSSSFLILPYPFFISFIRRPIIIIFPLPFSLFFSVKTAPSTLPSFLHILTSFSRVHLQ